MSAAVATGSPKKKKKDDSIVAPVLSYPSNNSQSSVVQEGDKGAVDSESTQKQINALKDENSSYTVVAKACLYLTQMFIHDSKSNNNSPDDTTVASSVLIHEATVIKSFSSTMEALVECLTEHKDRRCRILAATTMGTIGRSAYARIRPSPLLWSIREPSRFRLEDEIGTDVATALVMAALEETDPGVSAACFQGLGLLTLSSSTFAVGSSLVDDGLTREILAIAFPSVSPYYPSLRAVADEDPGVPQAELSARIWENILIPRLLALLDRFLLDAPHHPVCLVQSLPVLAATLAHQVKTSPATLFTMDSNTYAKQWAEVDARNLADTLVQDCLLPCLDGSGPFSMSGASNRTVMSAALLLAHVCPTAVWVPQICRAAVMVGLEDLSLHPAQVMTVEDKLTAISRLLIALRGVPIGFEKLQALQQLVPYILALPSTMRVPAPNIVHPGLWVDPKSSSSTSNSGTLTTMYRRPARVVLWTEIALAFFVDGPDPNAVGGNPDEDDHHQSRDPAIPYRHDCLARFLLTPILKQVIDEKSTGAMALHPRDEIAMAFFMAAIGAGRRFRGGPQGTWTVTDPVAPQVEEWCRLSWIVLDAFSGCVHLNHAGSKKLPVYLEEDLSLGTASLASYIQLLQEYLHVVGLLHPGSSVALKLVANACPPHLLWDQLADSASFISRFEPIDMNMLDKTGQLMQELIQREVKQGIPSHHMRLFMLSLAADHWMQGRVAAIRRHFEFNTPVHITHLDVPSGKEIILSLSPRRLLTKILSSHVPPVDAQGKKKKDPIRRLAMETVRVCVACVENIALIACDWRRRFGANNQQHHQEPKILVSTAVRVLQGQPSQYDIEGAPSSFQDMIKTTMAPLCDAAVSRIQAFYESDMGGADSFPASELVMQSVKTKIKPLVSSSKPPKWSVTDYHKGYLMQLSRQLMQSRVDLAVLSIPPADGYVMYARTIDWLRLAVPPMIESKDGRPPLKSNVLSAWGTQVASASTNSDAVALYMAYTPRRYLRYDGEAEYRLTALIRAYNTTAIEFTEGIQLNLGFAQGLDALMEEDFLVSDDGDKEKSDPLLLDMLDALQLDEVTAKAVDASSLASSTITYKQELKAGDFVTWEVSFRPIPPSGQGSVSLMPSVTYRNIPLEPIEEGSKWAGDKQPGGGDASTTTGGTGESEHGEDDFQVTQNISGIVKDGVVPTENLTLAGEPLKVSPLAQFQPCPLVFLRDSWGCLDSFRFMWFRLPFQLPEIPIGPIEGESPPKNLSSSIAEMSTLIWNGEAIPGGYATMAWAFGTLSGHKVLAVLAETDADNKTTLHLRGDDTTTLFGLVASRSVRRDLVAALLPGMEPVYYVD